MLQDVYCVSTVTGHLWPSPRWTNFSEGADRVKSPCLLISKVKGWQGQGTPTCGSDTTFMYTCFSCLMERGYRKALHFAFSHLVARKVPKAGSVLLICLLFLCECPIVFRRISLSFVLGPWVFTCQNTCDTCSVPWGNDIKHINMQHTKTQQSLWHRLH